MGFWVLLFGYNFIRYLGLYFCGAQIESQLYTAVILIVFLWLFLLISNNRSTTFSFGFYFKTNEMLPIWESVLLMTPGLLNLCILLSEVKNGAEFLPLCTIYGTVLMVSCGAVYEELVFRGYILKFFLKYGRRSAAFSSSALFSAAHFLNFNLNLEILPLLTQLAASFLVGYAFAVITLKNNTLIWAVLFHGWINLMAPENYLGTVVLQNFQICFYLISAALCFFSEVLYRKQM